MKGLGVGVVFETSGLKYPFHLPRVPYLQHIKEIPKTTHSKLNVKVSSIFKQPRQSWGPGLTLLEGSHRGPPHVQQLGKAFPSLECL